MTLGMVCPFEPAEKQALLEAPTEADRAADLLALLRMCAARARSRQPAESDGAAMTETVKSIRACWKCWFAR